VPWIAGFRKIFRADSVLLFEREMRKE